MSVSIPGSLHRTSRRIGDKHLDRRSMIDQVAAIAQVVPIRLDVTVRVCGPGQQGVSPWCLRSEPGKGPASPRMRLNGIYELCLSPCVAAVGAHSDLSNLCLAGPCSARNDIHLV